MPAALLALPMMFTRCRYYAMRFGWLGHYRHLAITCHAINHFGVISFNILRH